MFLKDGSISHMDNFKILLRNLSDIYTDHLKNGKDQWVVEKENVEMLIKAIQLKVVKRYETIGAISVGGTGIILKVHDKNLKVSRALKFPRPRQHKETLLQTIISSEITQLIESAHENVVSIYYRDEIKVNKQQWPFYVMEYIDGAVDAREFLQKWNMKYQTPDKKYECLISLVQQIVEGLDFLHSRDLIHCDVKLENILVAPNGKPKISDFGSARRLNPKDDNLTDFIITEQYAHPYLKKLASETSTDDPNIKRGPIHRSKLRVAFDLYALGKNILRLLYDEYNERLDSIYIPPYNRQYLALMAARMLDGDNNSVNEQPLGPLPKKAYEEIKYKTMSQVADDIKKITGEYAIHQHIRELDHHFPETIQISTPGATAFPKRVANILSSPFFRRLAGISQLGIIILIYPSASHSRLEHVLGTFANVARYCDALWNDPFNPLFRQIITEDDINLVLLTALCHDIGQYPLAHDFEGAEYEIFSHKEIGKKLLTSKQLHKSGQALKELEIIMKKEWNVTPAMITELMDTSIGDYKKPLKMRLLHSLIDGPIDADRLDYLVRDSNHLNVVYGKCIDFERLLRCLTVYINKETSSNTFISLAIHEKGKVSAEAVAFARYAMFGSVYWHHTSRSAKSMLHRVIWEALSKEGTSKKRETELKESFLREIGSQLYPESENSDQKTLFPNKIVLEENPQLTLSDYRMLLWLSEETTKIGKQLLKMICERDLDLPPFIVPLHIRVSSVN
jgi:HD superfamily phosphohydrolase/tRNA A-37 threonylcarbamoyl transferase component Bud32